MRIDLGFEKGDLCIQFLFIHRAPFGVHAHGKGDAPYCNEDIKVERRPEKPEAIKVMLVVMMVILVVVMLHKSRPYDCIDQRQYYQAGNTICYKSRISPGKIQRRDGKQVIDIKENNKVNAIGYPEGFQYLAQDIYDARVLEMWIVGSRDIQEDGPAYYV